MPRNFNHPTNLECEDPQESEASEEVAGVVRDFLKPEVLWQSTLARDTRIGGLVSICPTQTLGSGLRGGLLELTFKSIEDDVR